MRRLGFAVALLGGLGLGAATPGLQAADYTPKDLLKFRPTRSGVDYDNPVDQAAVDACKVEIVTDAQKRTVGYALRDGQNKLLRRFIITNGGKFLNQWSYYQDGFEVYRESDLDGDRSLDECRWMNQGGSRIATVQGGKIVGWKRISAEEASKMAVQALASNDLELLESLIATPDELKAAGLPAAVVSKVTADAGNRAERVQTLVKSLAGWSEKTVWNRFDGAMPHAIPADPASGVEKDLVLYENAVVFAGAPADATDQPAKLSFLQVPEMIQLGDVWKFVELPRAVDPEKPVVATVSGIRSAIFETSATGMPEHDEETEAALKALAEYDKANGGLIAGGDKKEAARFHFERIPLLQNVVKAVKDPEDRLGYSKQVVDSLVAAYQTGAYPQGRKAVDGLIEKGGPLASYASYRLISADFIMKNEEPGGNFVANQKKWMTELEAFLEKFPKSDEAPEGLLQLGSSNEFNAEEDKAREDYAKLVESFPETLAGKKAAGALRRLDLVGKSVSVKGEGADGQTIDTAALQGKTVLVVFWASWGGQAVRREIPDLMKLAEKYGPKGFQIVGVCLDNDKADLEAFQKETNVNWPQIFEPGGIEGRLAAEYGIISLPTMFLIDGQGKVIDRGLRSASEVDRQLEKAFAAAEKPAGVALGEK